MSAECSICLVDVESSLFISNGGLCDNCKKNVDLILSRGGDIEQLSKYTVFKRRETRKKVENFGNRRSINTENSE